MDVVQLKRVDALKAGDKIIGLADYSGTKVYKTTSVLHVIDVHEVKGYGKIEVTIQPNGKGRHEWIRRDTSATAMIK